MADNPSVLDQPTDVAKILTFPVTRRAVGPFEPWLGEDTVARHLGVSARTIRRWRASGMPSRLFEGARRYRLSDCESWHDVRRSP